MVAHICLHKSDKNLEDIVDEKLNWKDENNFKKATAEAKDVCDAFEKDIVCFFRPNKYMKPSWMGNNYSTDNISTYSLQAKYARQLNNPITAANMSDLTLQWLFDIIIDLRAD